MSVWRIGIIIFTLLISACHRHHPVWCPSQQGYTIQMVEAKYGTPNEIISKPNFTWYGYVTKLQTDYPVKKDFSRLYCPHVPIAKPVPLARNKPSDSSARCGCAVWFKANKSGLVIATKRTGEYCTEADYRKPIGV